MFGHYLIHPEGDLNSNDLLMLNEDWNEIEKDFLTSFDVKFKFNDNEKHSFDQHLAYIRSDDHEHPSQANEIVMPTKNFNERDVYRMLTFMNDRSDISKIYYYHEVGKIFGLLSE